jgi:hypothetical protein
MPYTPFFGGRMGGPGTFSSGAGTNFASQMARNLPTTGLRPPSQMDLNRAAYLRFVQQNADVLKPSYRKKQREQKAGRDLLERDAMDRVALSMYEQALFGGRTY